MLLRSIRRARRMMRSQWWIATPNSSTYGGVVGWAELPTAGNELHHFGWSAMLERTLPRRPMAAIRGSRSNDATYSYPASARRPPMSLDTKPDPRRPVLTHTIEATELAAKADIPARIRCTVDRAASSCRRWVAPTATTVRRIALIDHDTFEVIGPWEVDRGPQFLSYDMWWHLKYDTVITSEWATPSMIEMESIPRTCSEGSSDTT